MSFTPPSNIQTLLQVQANVNEGHYSTWEAYIADLTTAMRILRSQTWGSEGQGLSGIPDVDDARVAGDVQAHLDAVIPTWDSSSQAHASLAAMGGFNLGTNVTTTTGGKFDVTGGGGLTEQEIQRQRQQVLSQTIGGQRVTYGQEMAAAPYTMGQVTPFARSAMEAQFDPLSASYSLSQLTPMATGGAVPYEAGYGGAGGGMTFQEWMRDPTSQRLGAEDWTGYLGQLAGGIPQGAFAADPSVAGGFSFTPSSLPGGTAGYTQDQLDQMARMKAGWEQLSDPVIGSNIISQYALGPGAAAGGGISPMARSAYINALQDQFSAYQATPQGAVTPLMTKFLGGGFGLGYGA